MNVHKISEIVSNLPGLSRCGYVSDCVGLVVEADCPGVFVGEVCVIVSNNQFSGTKVLAEAVGFRLGKVILMPYQGVKGIRQGDLVISSNRWPQMSVGDGLLGRVVDAFGNPLDGLGEISQLTKVPIRKDTINPMSREPIVEPLETGIRAIDAFTTFGIGQRIALMAGSGVGKSTLLSSLCKNVKSDINIVALIGERGREVEDFVNQTLGEEGLKKCVVIAATAQDSPLIRAQAAYGAIAAAEYFASKGKNVFFTMDSITRFATALREVGLAAGESPTVKGYTPSVFSAIPDVVERCGNFKSQGSISAILTVLVESDDFNDPVVDSVRAILDGHIVLSRELAEQSHFPAIDISKSISRLYNQLNGKSEIKSSSKLRKLFTDYQQNKEILELGLFEGGDSQDRDKLKANWKTLEHFLIQDREEASSMVDTTKRMLALET